MGDAAFHLWRLLLPRLSSGGSALKSGKMTARLIKAILIGAGCAAIGLTIRIWPTVSFWPKISTPYYGYAYQEYSTPNPDQGFEHIVGYTGSQTFYWDEILVSRDFKLMLLKERGENPQTKLGILDALSAQPYDEFSKVNKRGLYSLYIMMSLLPSQYPAEHFRRGITQDFIPISRAFVEAARIRGVTVSPVGEIAIYTKEIGSWRTILQYNWLPYLTLGCASAVAVVLLGCKSKNRSSQPSELS
jgi:hypothetical protein